uniref:uncharacterized protein n=1 Tax=Centroberyx gerrardi TaxID=166262 RepID=UPI003AAF1A16
MPVRQKDAQRALGLLQQYRAKLGQREQNQNRTKQGRGEEDHQLQQSLDRVITVFQSQLFNALLDIQEYYELTLLEDSQLSVEEPDGPGELPASCGPPAELSAQPQPADGPLSPQASGGPAQPKSPAPEPKPVKSPAPPIPPGSPSAKSPTPTTPSNTPQSQPAKVKYRAPLPPVQPGASKSSTEGTSKPSSPSTPTANGVETLFASSLNGQGPRVASAARDASPGASAPLWTAANPQSSPASLNLRTVSALVSSTIQGLMSPTSPDKPSPASTPPSTSPDRISNSANISMTHTSIQDPGPGRVTPSLSPTSPNSGKFTFGSRSPTVAPGPPPKAPHLSPTSPGPAKVTSTSPTHGAASPRTASVPRSSTLTPNNKYISPAMTTYFHSHEFCCSPKKPSSGSTKGKAGKGKAKTGKNHHSHHKQNQNFLQIQTPNHQLQPSPLHSPKHQAHSPKQGRHSPKHLLPSPSPSYYHIAPPSPSHQLGPPSPNYQLAPQSPNHLLHSTSCHQMQLSPSHHQLQLHSQHQQQFQPLASPNHLISPSHHHIYQQQQQQLHSPNHHAAFLQQYQHHHHYPPPLPHASQSLSIHPFLSPQLPLSAGPGSYGWSTLPTNLTTRSSRGKFPNLRDSVKKSPTKSKAKGKAGSRPWPNDTYIWTTHSLETPTHTPLIHHIPQIQAHVQANPPPVVVNTDSIDTPPY